MRKEFQLKVAGTVEPAFLTALGAEPLGQTLQKDYYLAADDDKTWRIREEGGNFMLTKKGYDMGQKARIKEVHEEPISAERTAKLKKTHGVKAVVCKSQSLYRLLNTVIAVDEVEHLGSFVEVRSVDESTTRLALQTIGFAESAVIRESYLEMMTEKKVPKWLQALIRIHERIGELSFGITSGILTIAGVLVGVNFGTASALAVIVSIMVVAIADSCSDAYGMYTSRAAERGASKGAALRYALGTLAGKFFMPLTFIIPILLMPLGISVWVSLAWGALVLSLLSAEQALVAQESVWKAVLKNLILVVFITVLSAGVGHLANIIVGTL